MTYLEFEKKMYEALLNEHKKNNDFTFSLRKKKSKGADLDYFIGTEKGGYSGTTFWTIPIGYPGNSSDLINLFFYKYKNNEFGFHIEFNQTISPHNDQNKQALLLIQNLKNDLTKFTLNVSESKKNCKYFIKNNIKYSDFNVYFTDIVNIVNEIKPIVDKEIINLKKINPNFVAHRITKVEFSNMTLNLQKRLSINDNINTRIENDNESNINNSLKSENKQEQNCTSPKNQILYGPPGTGKTYNTIHLASKIITRNKNITYDEAVKIYKENLGDRIKFVTFHQNFSYEDFVQGLRPETDSDTMSFDYKDGIFKEIAEKAKTNIETSLGKKSNKLEFENVYNDFCSSIINEELEEIEVKMKKVSYFITSVSEKSINFRKNSGGTSHTLSVKTLKKMYDSESLLNHSGLLSYYEPLLNLLLDKGKKEKSNIEKSPKQSYVLIIDEINRANISRVFGELITLIEDDKRWDGGEDMNKVKWEVTLPSGEQFVVPDNLYIIGTMNTADKSIALLDVALRRRFVFRAMYPMKDIDGNGLDSSLINNHELLTEINNYIIDEKNGLGPGRGHDLQIGHSYFMTPKDKTFDLVETMNNKVIPLLMEYFMNDYKKVKEMLEEILKKDKIKKLKLGIVKNSYPILVELYDSLDDSDEAEQKGDE